MRLLIFWGLFFCASCVNSEEEVKAISARRLGVDEAIGMEAYMSSGGNMRARLRAPLMLRYQDTSAKVVFPNTMHVDFFQDSTEGVVKSQLDARYGEYFEQRNLVFLRDSVRVFNTTGDTLFCAELWWSQNDQRFYTDKPVRIHRPDMIMMGVGLSAPQDFSYFEMYRITNSVIRVNQ
jgi:LPS export ABC transporter protein LptC